MSNYNRIREGSNESPLLMVLVGESGAGKSTFCSFLDRPDKYYSSSGALEDELDKLGMPKNHDTIHAFANEAYGQNPEWQVPIILGKLAMTNYLILDGPRRVEEVKALKRDYLRTWIVRIATSEQERYHRLQARDGVDNAAFERIIEDEGKALEVGQILDMADDIINNDGDVEHLREKALEVQKILDQIEGDQRQC